MKVKIVVVGPQKSGKTILSNYLLGHTENLVAASNESYNPTVGCRILEGEIAATNRIGSNSSSSISVELWDSSGDTKYEACWKAIMHESDGVVLIYNPDSPLHDQQLNDWFDFFVRKNHLKDDQCLLFAHRMNSSNANDRFRPRKYFLTNACESASYFKK